MEKKVAGNQYTDSKYQVFGVLRCSSNECGIVIDRDINAAKNILHCLNNILNGHKRPTHLINDKT